MHHRLTRWLFPAVLLVLLALGTWHYFRWLATYNYWSQTFVGGLENAVIGLDRLKTATDPGDISLTMPTICGVTHPGVTSGRVLDIMIQNGSPRRIGILDRVLLERSLFARDLCQRRGLKPPVAGSRENEVLPPEDFAQLAQVAVIYRDHFTGAVVRSGNYQRQRRALTEAHESLKRTGLAKLLLNPELLDQGF